MSSFFFTTLKNVEFWADGKKKYNFALDLSYVLHLRKLRNEHLDLYTDVLQQSDFWLFILRSSGDTYLSLMQVRTVKETESVC